MPQNKGMTKFIILFFLTATIILSGCSNSNQPVKTNLDVIGTEIDSLVSHYHQNQQFSGAVLVADNGEVMIHKQYGYTSLDSTQLINDQSVFEIASISKQFTAMLVMMLQEEGLLSYEDNLLKHFPGLPYKNITIKHLLTHTSGIAERLFFMWGARNMDRSKVYHNDMVLQYLTEQKPHLAFEPGTKWEYSNVGYFLLALILEQTTGKHYIELLQERILKPLAMEHTGIYSEQFKGNQMDNYVFGKLYNAKGHNFHSSFGMSWSDSIYGSVGILSNSIDLLKWDKALSAHSLVDEQTLAEAFTSYELSDKTPSEYGFGWYVSDSSIVNGIDRGKKLNHNGLWPGYESSIVRYPESRITIIILANQSPSAKDRLVDEISALVFK